jgi:hypothetical protein
MSQYETLLLIGILAAFGTFGTMLAWAEYQTRHLPRASAEHNANDEKQEQHWKAAA